VWIANINIKRRHCERLAFSRERSLAGSNLAFIISYNRKREIASSLIAPNSSGQAFLAMTFIKNLPTQNGRQPIFKNPRNPRFLGSFFEIAKRNRNHG